MKQPTVHLIEYSPLIGHHLPYLKTLSNRFSEKNHQVKIWVIDEKNKEKLIQSLTTSELDKLDIQVLKFFFFFKVLLKIGRFVFPNDGHSLGVWGLVKANLTTQEHEEDLVFMTWLQHSCTRLPKSIRQWILPRRWMAIDGFAIHSSAVLEEENFDTYLEGTQGIQIYEEDSCQAVLLLNEEMPSILKLRFPNTRFIKFPDFIEPLNPTDKPDVCQLIRQEARGRKIFLFVGRMIEKRNFISFLHLLPYLDHKQWQVCLIGELELNLYPKDEQTFIKIQLASFPEITVQFQRPGDYELDALIESADLLWLAYMNHPHSSNMLTRAAHYKTAVVATSGTLIAHRVIRYEMGLSVNPYNAISAAKSINKFNPQLNPFHGYQQYAQQQSIQQIDHTLDQVLTP